MKKILILIIIVAAVVFYMNREKEQLMDSARGEQNQNGAFSHLPKTVDNARDAAKLANQHQQQMQESQDQSN